MQQIPYICKCLELFDLILIFYTYHGGYSDLGSAFWGMILVLASTNLLTARIAAGCFIAALLVVLIVAKNVSTKYCFTS